MDNVVEKIRKLLAKATSQNEHEAQAALLKARELMAKHKLTEMDVGDAKPANRKLKNVGFTDVLYSAKTNTWFPKLAAVIAENHCCAAVTATLKNSIQRMEMFTGLDDDPEMALEVFRYAVQHIKDRVKQERKAINARYEWQDSRNYAVRRFENSYAEGFASALRQQYKEQFKNAVDPNNDCMALVMVVPQEVKDYVGGLSYDKIKFR